MNDARATVRAWTLGLRGVLAELGAARLRWCVVCGRVGLRGWQPLCAAMPITWICADRPSCRDRQALGAFLREPQWRRLVLRRRPGSTRPPTRRPWRLGGMASPSWVLHHDPQLLVRSVPTGGALAVPELAARAEKQAGDPAAELPVLVRRRPDAASPGRGGDGQ